MTPQDKTKVLAVIDEVAAAGLLNEFIFELVHDACDCGDGEALSVEAVLRSYRMLLGLGEYRS